MTAYTAVNIEVKGIVQGVGFRPFIYNQAVKYNLSGWVRNTSGSVIIHVEGDPVSMVPFIEQIQSDVPSLAVIEEFTVSPSPPQGYSSFEILQSIVIPEASQPISPDISICDNCYRELMDKSDRRYRYPFINCTDCGPRFTIIQDIPYDRAATTMATFEMCPECAKEYSDPSNRRFHAQPVACPVCGPKVWLVVNPELLTTNSISSSPQLKTGIPVESDAAILATQSLIRQGNIVAVKGLGGFHLACDATSPSAVARLRERKLRVDKPFAVMMHDIDTVDRNCYLSETERELLVSPSRPIILLNRRPNSSIALEVAPVQNTIGVMLPYTPLHYLLFENDGYERDIPPLVMTSGNLSEEPICTDNDDAINRLSAIADAFLLHDRPIGVRCDDSVIRSVEPLTNDKSNLKAGLYPIRRSRGYAPIPIRLSTPVLPTLAGGAELKNTFCIAKDNYAIVSHHIGDMENFETLQSFENGITHFQRLFRFSPELFAYDLHPNYLATRYIQERAAYENKPSIGVQHHHAHIAACMADNGISPDENVIGLSFDGTGYGEDGAIWGGEFLVVNCKTYDRFAHLEYVPLPGGDVAIKSPSRTALAYLWKNHLDWDMNLRCVAAHSHTERSTLLAQLNHGINTPLTSSMGRLFDAVAALIGIRQKVNYEAQAAIEMEAIVDHNLTNESYPFTIDNPSQADSSRIVGTSPLINSIINDIKSGCNAVLIATKFHNTIAQMALLIALEMNKIHQIRKVALSGGVWQNVVLLEQTLTLLHRNNFQVFVHRQIPTNDGGVALGQAVIAAAKHLSIN